MEEERVAKKLVSESDQIDRLSDLPDDILHQIFSSLDTKYLVRTSLLSNRWISLWTSAQYINFDSSSFNNFNSFKNFVLTVLRQRPPDTKICKLSFCTERRLDKSLTNAVIDYAFSHDVEHLIVKPNNVRGERFQDHIRCGGFFVPETFDLSKLTTLHLEGCKISSGRVSSGLFDFLVSCPNVINLCLIRCRFSEFKDYLKLSGPKLVKINMEDVSCSKLEISAPKVASFSFKKWDHVDSFSLFNLPFLQDVEVESSSARPKIEGRYFDKLFKLLQGLHNAQSVTLNSFLTMDLINSAHMLVHQPSPFGTRLKTLTVKIDPRWDYPRVPNKVKNYLLGGSPSAEFRLSTD